jgi:hypothetical protein
MPSPSVRARSGIIGSAITMRFEQMRLATHDGATTPG